MKTLRLSLRLLARDWKSGELIVLVTALVVAVTALTAVGFLTDRVGHAVELRAAESLAADLRLSSPRPFSPLYVEQAVWRQGLEFCHYYLHAQRGFFRREQHTGRGTGSKRGLSPARASENNRSVTGSGS